MSIFFISADIAGVNTRFMLDSTTKIQVVDTGKLTKHPVQTGADVADNYVNQNKKITFSGRVSDVKAVQSILYNATRVDGSDKVHRIQDFVPSDAGSVTVANVRSFIKNIQKLKSDKISFTVEAGELGVYTNCFFTSLVIVQDKTAGTFLSGDGNLSSIKVAFTAEQVRFGTAAELVVLRDKFIVKDFSKTTTTPPNKVEIPKEVLETRFLGIVVNFSPQFIAPDA